MGWLILIGYGVPLTILLSISAACFFSPRAAKYFEVDSFKYWWDFTWMSFIPCVNIVMLVLFVWMVINIQPFIIVPKHLR